MNQTKQNSIITYIGQNPGLSTAIFVGVHGNEPCGIRAIENFFKHNSIENGTVIVVFANPHAIEKNVRFTEFNLNRAFKNIDEYPDEIKSTYEVQRAQELKKILEDVDVLLDIHSSTSIESEPFVICEQNAMTYVNAFPESFSKVVSGFDNLQPGGTDWYMNSVGKVGICIECGFHTDKEAVINAEQAIGAFLVSLGHIIGESVINTNRTYIQMSEMYCCQTNHCAPVKNFADFEIIPAHSVIALDGNTEVSRDWDSVILFARKCEKIGDEVFLLGQIQ